MTSVGGQGLESHTWQYTLAKKLMQTVFSKHSITTGVVVVVVNTSTSQCTVNYRGLFPSRPFTYFNDFFNISKSAPYEWEMFHLKDHDVYFTWKKYYKFFRDFSLIKFYFKLTFEGGGDSFTLPLIEIINLFLNRNVSN